MNKKRNNEIPKRRCAFCHCWYQPDPRTTKQQRACKKDTCRKARKSSADRSWQIKHPGYGKSRKLKIRAWAQSYPYYWRQYRKKHPDYCLRDNQRRGLAAKRVCYSAKQDAIRQISLEKLWSIQEIGLNHSAKQDGLARQLNGVMDYLIWKESSAKQDSTDLALISELES